MLVKDLLSILSIKDIARAANVSHSTVSRALRNSSLVRAETAEKIQRIAREANFRVSAVGRSLATGRTFSIGVVVTTIADPFMADVVAGIEETANAHGYSVTLASSKTDPEREMKLVQSFEERRVDGILIIASRVGSVYLSVLAEMKIPIVLINSYHPGEFTYSVSVDNIAASRSATRFLIQLGHRNIGFIGNRYGAQSNLGRLTGYRQGPEDAGIHFHPESVFLGDARVEGGFQALEHFVSLAETPTALVCYNDLTAVGVLNSAYRRKIVVPDELSVVGFDDLTIASYANPPLTTVRQPKHEMGRVATEIVFNLLAGSTTEKSYTFQTDLILRDSTAPPRRRTD
jgi:DNA-binding LacI/PurR family transcriptional regulator